MQKKPYTSNSSDEQSVAASKKKVASKKLLEEADMRKILDNDAGRRVLWRILEKCGIFRSGYVGGSDQMFFLEGRRDVGNHILSDILGVDPTYFTRMIEENSNGRRRSKSGK